MFDESTVELTARYISARCFGICTEQSVVLAFCQALRLFLKSPYWSSEWKKSNHHVTKFIPDTYIFCFQAGQRNVTLQGSQLLCILRKSKCYRNRRWERFLI